MVVSQPQTRDQFPPVGDAAWTPPASDQDHNEADVRWFAGLAMQAIIGRMGVPTAEPLREEIALWSFRMAEAMVKADESLHGTRRA